MFTRLTRTMALVAASAAVLAVTAQPADARGRDKDRDDELGTRSLATVLAADGRRYDGNPFDFDITEAAVYAVLEAKPTSPVAVLADGTVPLTAFLPTDFAFKDLVNQVAGYDRRSEAETFAAVAGLGIDTVEAVLLYHVVPGATVDYRAALGLDGTDLTTAGGGILEVAVERFFRLRYVSLVDADTDDRDAIVIRPDLNRGNVQIAHGISSVLRPIDLP